MTVETENETQNQKKQFPPYNVILLDDNDHTFEYVIKMVRTLFAFSEERAAQVAKEVDTTGRVILITTTKERAELKQEQIHEYGADPNIPDCKGSMSAIIETAI